jgi:hypothetical protein
MTRPSPNNSDEHNRHGTRALWRVACSVVFGRTALVVVGIIAIAVIAFPWQLAPASRYSGFDKNMLFAEGQSGDFSIAPTKVVIKSSNGSTPSLHAVTSENPFEADLDVTVKEESSYLTWHDVSATIHPPQSARYFTVLVGAVNSVALFTDIRITRASDTSPSAASVIFTERFGADTRKRWRFGDGAAIVAQEQGRSALRIAALGSVEKGAWISKALPFIAQGDSYKVTASMRYETAPSPFKIAVDWLDGSRQHISYAPDWSDWAQGVSPVEPLRVRVWYPANYGVVDLRFLPDPTHSVVAGTQDGHGYTAVSELGRYQVGKPFHIRVVVNPGKSIRFVAGDREAGARSYQQDRGDLDLFSQPYLNLSFDATAATGFGTSTELTNFELLIPAQTLLSSKASDLRLDIALGLILAWFIMFLAVHYGTRLVRIGPSLMSEIDRARSALPTGLTRVALAVGSLSAVLILLLLASFLGGHPYDRMSQETWAYVIQQYGIGSIYDRTNAAPDSLVRGGHAAWSSLGFAYMPALSYPYLIIVKIWNGLGHSISPMQDAGFYAFWKLCLSTFVVVEGTVLAYVFLRVEHIRRAAVLLAVGLLVLNPAVIIDSAVWGETDAVLVSSVLVGLAAFLTGRLRLAWAAIAVAVLLKQTALLFLPILALYSMKRFGFARSVEEGAFSSVLGVVIVTPLVFAGYGPSTTYLPAVAQFGFFAAAPANLASGDTFSVWTLVNRFYGLHGFDRILMPNAIQLPGDTTFGQVGLAIWFGLLLFTLFVLARRNVGPGLDNGMVWGLALLVVAYVAVSPKASSRYLILALPLILLGAKWPLSLGKAALYGALSAISALSMYGLFMEIAVRGEWTEFAGLGTPSTNWFSGAVYAIYTSDEVMTGGSIVLITAVVALAYLSWYRSRDLGAQRHQQELRTD